MTDDPYADRKRLSFAQAEGAVALPSQLQPKEVSDQLAALIWAIVYASMRDCFKSPSGPAGYASSIPTTRVVNPWATILYNYHVLEAHLAADDFLPIAHSWTRTIKGLIFSRDYIVLFGFLEFVLRQRILPPTFVQNLEKALATGRAAYRVVDGDTIIPIGSEVEHQTLERAFADLVASEFHGARAHLRAASSALSAGDYSTSVRESVHAVESVARAIWPTKSLRESLGQLEKMTNVHPALRKGFEAIYGYTSDEQGIRHPLVDGSGAKVDETDALFMIGACASFVSYLINKACACGLLQRSA